jgi:hypothetical protein
MAALTMALVLTASTEQGIASNFRTSNEALYAADDRYRAGDGRPADDSRLESRAGRVDAINVQRWSAGGRTLADGTTIDLTQFVNMANCEKATACSFADLDNVTVARPWGPNNPRWQPFAYGTLSNLLPGAPSTRSST